MQILKWYRGQYIPYRNEPGSGIFFFGGDYERHWTALAARILVEFYLREWKWVWGTVIALSGLYIALKKIS